MATGIENELEGKTGGRETRGRLLPSSVLRPCCPQDRSSAHGQKCRFERHLVGTVGRLWDRLDMDGEGERAIKMGLSFQAGTNSSEWGIWHNKQ